MILNLWIIIRFLITGILLLNVSMEDYRHYRIPGKYCLFLIGVGIVDSLLMKRTWIECIIGFFVVSSMLMFIYIVTKGRGIGGGDIKLVAASGILLGWKNNILAFIIACFSVVVFYPMRKKFFTKRTQLAFGPYLSFGIMISLLAGDLIYQAYMEWPGI